MLKLAILSTAKHLKYSMKYTDLRWSFTDTQNLLQMFNLHQIFTICHQSYVCDGSVIFGNYFVVNVTL